MIHGVSLETRVNGDVRQHDNTANMVVLLHQDH